MTYLSADQITAITLLAVCGPPLPRSADRLSDREIEAIQLRSAGRGNSSIGRRLKVSHTAVHKWFAKPLVRACLNRYIESGGKELYPAAVYPDRQAKREAETNNQRVSAFRDWLLFGLVDMGTPESPERFRENLDIILSEAKSLFWPAYFAEHEPERTAKEIRDFLRKE